MTTEPLTPEQEAIVDKAIALAEKTYQTFSEEEPGIIATALSRMMGIFLMEHSEAGTPKATARLREGLLGAHIKAVRAYVEIMSEKEPSDPSLQ